MQCKVLLHVQDWVMFTILHGFSFFEHILEHIHAPLSDLSWKSEKYSPEDEARVLLSSPAFSGFLFILQFLDF